ncbi:hypothetical protein GCM10010971_31620 [Silvimonas amylolytica]|uniref:Uncharacterized protein n=1 Tax=Silvimonas amylolytica TaxID=449663 RepID=A0ABQ2PNZ3_9NEIS|nr:hypothetical protein GCM10010971_31620 [Silvimonas amylolytica]
MDDKKMDGAATVIHRGVRLQWHHGKAARQPRYQNTQRRVVMKRVCVLVALLLAASLSACNTVKGAGQDIQKGGEKLENSADQHSS